MTACYLCGSRKSPKKGSFETPGLRCVDSEACAQRRREEVDADPQVLVGLTVKAVEVHEAELYVTLDREFVIRAPLPAVRVGDAGDAARTRPAPRW